MSLLSFKNHKHHGIVLEFYVIESMEVHTCRMESKGYQFLTNKYLKIVASISL